MAAIGAAGAIGAVGSGLLRLMDHDPRETATWIALVLVGGTGVGVPLACAAASPR
jgi:hypothetical protein